MHRFVPPIHRSLWAFAAVAWVGTLITDITYWRTADFIWVDASDWLVTIGVIVGFVALIAALVEMFAFARRYAPPAAFAVAALVAWILAALDMLIHTHDSWTSIMPWGLTLSALTVLVLAIAYAIGRGGRLPVPHVLNTESAR